jgi:hypothetical protein
MSVDKTSDDKSAVVGSRSDVLWSSQNLILLALERLWSMHYTSVRLGSTSSELINGPQADAVHQRPLEIISILFCYCQPGPKEINVSQLGNHSLDTHLTAINCNINSAITATGDNDPFCLSRKEAKFR